MQNEITFKSLSEIPMKDVLDLMNHPLLIKHMPLLKQPFSEKDYSKFIKAKQAMWDEAGYGPWAFEMNGDFIGWGGLQPEAGEVEIALILHPNYWGYGKELYRQIIEYAKKQDSIESVVIFFPPTRSRIKAILREGFKKDGECKIDGAHYIRYRLTMDHQSIGKA